MEYQAYIRNITIGKWLKTKQAGTVEHTENQNEILVFVDEDDAESTLEYLNDNFSDAYVLQIEDDENKLLSEPDKDDDE